MLIPSTPHEWLRFMESEGPTSGATVGVPQKVLVVTPAHHVLLAHPEVRDLDVSFRVQHDVV